MAFAIIGFAQAGIAKPFRIAALYPATNLGHINCTCAQEAACITGAVVAEARKEGVEVSVDFIDTKWNPLKTLAGAQEIAAKRYDAAVGTLISTDALMAVPVLEKAGIPFVVPTASNPRVTEGRSFVARIAFNDYRQAFLLARLAKEEYRPKRVAIIRNVSQPYSDFLGKEFAVQIRKMDPGVIISEHILVDGFKDFKKLAGEATAGNPDLLFVPISQVQLSSLYVELVNRRASLALLGSDTVEGQLDFVKTLGLVSTSIRFVFPKHWNERLEGPAAKHYGSLYRSHCGKYPLSMASAAAYDAISLMIQTLKKYPAARGKEFIRRLKSMEYVGMTGPMRYGPDGEPIKALELFTIRDGKTVYWRRYE